MTSQQADAEAAPMLGDERVLACVLPNVSYAALARIAPVCSDCARLARESFQVVVSKEPDPAGILAEQRAHYVEQRLATFLIDEGGSRMGRPPFIANDERSPVVIARVLRCVLRYTSGTGEPEDAVAEWSALINGDMNGDVLPDESHMVAVGLACLRELELH